MKTRVIFSVLLIVISLSFAEVKNPDKPLKGEWNFDTQKLWERDRVGAKLFERPSELRASQDEMLYFHDFDYKVSYVFNHNGEFINSFAKQGEASGEVGRYLNCFTAGDKVVIGTPNKSKNWGWFTLVYPCREGGDKKHAPLCHVRKQGRQEFVSKI